MAVWTCDDSRILLSSSVGHCYSLDSVHGRQVQTVREVKNMRLCFEVFVLVFIRQPTGFSRACSSKMMLKGHSTECWVIEGHPWNPDLALSGGYDACVALWDLKSGKCLQKFSDTPCAITDGHWSPDGTGIAVIDSVGQLKVGLTIYGISLPLPLPLLPEVLLYEAPTGIRHRYRVQARPGSCTTISPERLSLSLL